jgi:hypothetical protein
MRKLISSFALALIGTLVINAASAQTTLNLTTGTGFAAKGDVQSAFGWNNAKLQSNASGVTFSYNATETYEGVCEWTTGENSPNGAKTHTVTHGTSTSVNSAVSYQARTNSQGVITGFNLTGFGTTTHSGADVPVVGGPCPGNPGTGAIYTSVTKTGSTGGLYAIYGGNSVLIWSGL